jgi:hypothetical protein
MRAEAASRLSHRKVGVQNHSIDTVVTTFKKLTVQRTQLVGNGDSSEWEVFFAAYLLCASYRNCPVRAAP